MNDTLLYKLNDFASIFPINTERYDRVESAVHINTTYSSRKSYFLLEEQLYQHA